MSLLAFFRKIRRKIGILKIFWGIILCCILFVTIIKQTRKNAVSDNTQTDAIEDAQEVRIKNDTKEEGKRDVGTRSITAITTSTLTSKTVTETVFTEPPKPKLDLNQVRKLQSLFKKYSTCIAKHFKKLSASLTSPSFYEAEEALRKTCFIELFGSSSGNVCKWPAPRLVGPLYVNFTEVDIKELYKDELDFVQVGGKWSPEHCASRQKVAIIIPFRDRSEHLTVFLRQIHKMLKRQEYSYRIIVIEQSDEYPFNRGKLMNIGFAEALKLSPRFTCFVFHDVDLIPENDFNDYGCPTSPRHMSHAVDKFEYRLPYPGIFGGVEAFLKPDFERVNGFPNAYWGWGAEDDNLYKRVIQNGFTLTRPSVYHGRYKMIKHESSKDAPPNRHDKLNNAQAEFQSDGLSSLQYRVLNQEIRQLYTYIQVDLNMEGDSIY